MSITPHYQPRCTVRTFNSSHAAGLGVQYGRECAYGYYKFKTLPSWTAVGIKRRRHRRIKFCVPIGKTTTET